MTCGVHGRVVLEQRYIEASLFGRFVGQQFAFEFQEDALPFA
jgi:hypothetical protein